LPLEETKQKKMNILELKDNQRLPKFFFQTTHFKTFAGIICDSGAASMRDCHVFVDEGMTNPKSKYHSTNKLKKKKKVKH